MRTGSSCCVCNSAKQLLSVLHDLGSVGVSVRLTVEHCVSGYFTSTLVQNLSKQSPVFGEGEVSGAIAVFGRSPLYLEKRPEARITPSVNSSTLMRVHCPQNKVTATRNVRQKTAFGFPFQ